MPDDTPDAPPDAELIATIGKGEVTRAVPWSTLTPEQRSFQRTKMAIHAAMITRMDDLFLIRPRCAPPCAAEKTYWDRPRPTL